jgi:hypothetical protein
MNFVIRCTNVSNVSRYQIFCQMQYTLEKYHQRIGKHFALWVKYLKFLYLAQLWVGLSPRKPINRRTYANHWFLELGCRLNHSLKTELPNYLKLVIYRKQINIRNVVYESWIPWTVEPGHILHFFHVAFYCHGYRMQATFSTTIMDTTCSSLVVKISLLCILNCYRLPYLFRKKWP